MELEKKRTELEMRLAKDQEPALYSLGSCLVIVLGLPILCFLVKAFERMYYGYGFWPWNW